MPKKYPDHEYLKKNLNWEYPSKIEWDLTNGPLSSSTLRFFFGPFSRSCWRFLGEYCPETPSSTVKKPVRFGLRNQSPGKTQQSLSFRGQLMPETANDKSPWKIAMFLGTIKMRCIFHGNLILLPNV